MVVCPSGTGVAKPGFAALQYVGPAAIGGALAGLSGWAGAGVGAALGLLSYDLSTFCPNGPPTPPTFTAAEVIAALSPVPLPGSAAALLKLNDFLGAVFWPTFCTCTAGVATPPTPSSYPTGAPQQIPNPTPFISGACARFQQTGCIGYCSGTSSNWLSVNIPRGATSYRISSTGSIQSGGGQTYKYTMQEFAGGAGVTTDVTTIFTPGVPKTFVGTIRNPNATFLGANISGATLGGCACADDLLEIFCNGDQPGAIQSSCCPPDPATQAVLDRILGLVTVIQRQAAPFAYVYGANHTALSGHGSLSTSGLLGVSVDVTTLPSSYGSAVGSPERLFDVGFVTLGTADGYEQSRRIDADGTLFIPPSAGLYTAIGYSLGAGVVASIRELVREP